MLTRNTSKIQTRYSKAYHQIKDLLKTKGKISLKEKGDSLLEDAFFRSFANIEGEEIFNYEMRETCPQVNKLIDHSAGWSADRSGAAGPRLAGKEGPRPIASASGEANGILPEGNGMLLEAKCVSRRRKIIQNQNAEAKCIASRSKYLSSRSKMFLEAKCRSKMRCF